MVYIKPQSLVYAMVLFTTIFVTVGASAAPVNLSCTERGQNSPARAVTIDESSQTASFGDDSPSGANFTETKIKWYGTFAVRPNFSDYEAFFLLDRVTGELNVRYTDILSHLSDAEFECAVTARKF